MSWRASIRFAPAATLPCLALAALVGAADAAALDGVGCRVVALVGVGLVNRGAELACDVVTRWRHMRGRALALCLAVVGVAVNAALLMVLPAVLDGFGYDAEFTGAAVTAGGVLMGAAFAAGFALDETEFFVEKASDD